MAQAEIESVEQKVISPMDASSTGEQETDIPTYKVGVFLTDVREIDLSNGSYEVSFWLTISSEDIDFIQDGVPDIDYINGIISQTEHESTEPHYYEYKAHGTFHNIMDFTNHPFSKIDLPIIIEPTGGDITKIVFLVDEDFSGTDENIFIPGWNLVNTYTNSTLHHYTGWGDFSRIIHHFEVETPLLASLMTNIFPILVISIVGLLLFGFNPTDHAVRGEVIVGLIIAAVFFHILDIGGGLPPLEYLTLQDKLMAMLYVLLITVFAEVPIQRKFNEHDDYEKSKQINTKMRKYVMPIMLGIAFIVLFLVV